MIDVHCMCGVQCTELKVPDVPHLPEKASHMVTFDPADLYIDRSDFREVRTGLSCVVSNEVWNVTGLCDMF